jgi:uncharacterized protein
MKSIADRLSHIAALRPNPGTTASYRCVSPDTEKLIRLINGDVRSNRHGTCLRVEKRFSLEAPRMISRVFRLMGGVSEENPGTTGQWMLLDTETTGLSGGTGTCAFLTGLAWWEGDELVVEQFFMSDYQEESSMLFEIARRLRQCRVLVTFNGKSFDWPLLKTRYQMKRACDIPVFATHLDLLHPARQIWRLRLGSVALTELERHVLRFDRGRDIRSETIPGRYFDFVRGGPPAAIAEVFYHNQMDLLGLARLVLHMTDILHDPEKSGCLPEELFGISRLLQNRGEVNLAGSVYRRCLKDGLPVHAERKVHRELAIIAKRERKYDISNAHWEKLIDGSAEGMNAYEQLAIYYEHHASQLQKAAALSREALVSLRESLRQGRLSVREYASWHSKFQRRLARISTRTAAGHAGFISPERREQSCS